MELQKTKNYDHFKLTPLNRKGLNKGHIHSIKESLKQNNLLHLKPITVDKNMVILDGNHRFTAAKELGLPIYYTITEATVNDIVALNTALQWGPQDYLNFYVQQGYQEYINFNHFIRKHNLPMRVAMSLAMDSKQETNREFRNGTLKFNLEIADEIINCIRDVQDKIRLYYSQQSTSWVDSAKFWKALVLLVTHDNFDKQRFLNNIDKMISHFTVKVSQDEYQRMLTGVYNYKCKNRIELPPTK